MAGREGTEAERRERALQSKGHVDESRQRSWTGGAAGTARPTLRCPGNPTPRGCPPATERALGPGSLFPPETALRARAPSAPLSRGPCSLPGRRRRLPPDMPRGRGDGAQRASPCPSRGGASGA